MLCSAVKFRQNTYIFAMKEFESKISYFFAFQAIQKSVFLEVGMTGAMDLAL